MDPCFHFTCRGHPNITATHPSTVEITKDWDLTPAGDCIIGVCADVDAACLKQFLHGAQALAITLSCNGKKETITATYNSLFEPQNELVIRRGPFASPRTLATHADCSCIDFSPGFVEMIKNPHNTIHVEIRKIVSSPTTLTYLNLAEKSELIYLTPQSNHLLNMVKAKFNLKDKSAAVETIIEHYVACEGFIF